MAEPSPEKSTERRRNEPESLRVRTMSPAYTVDDLERSLKLYVDGMGFTVKDRWEEDGKLLGVMLVAGSVQLGLSQDDWSKGRDRKKGVGTSLYLQTVQDLDALAARCRAHGVEVYGPKTEPWGARVLHVVDPDGFKLVFTPPETPAAD
jgi:lactoylglutathione lyase